MKSLIISDTHGYCANLERVLKKIKPIDMLVHLGDIERDREYIAHLCECPMKIVAGNNDFASKDPKELLWDVGNHRILITHGHRYAVYGGPELIKSHARLNNADIVMYGHTHVPKLDLSDDVWVVNPGSLSYPRNSSKCSYIMMELDLEGEIHFTLIGL